MSASLGQKSVLRFFKENVVPKTLFLSLGFPKDAFGSIDVTNRCNLRCKHCYFFEQDHPEELSVEQWKPILKKLGSGIQKTRSITWIGGEPLLRKEIIEYGKGFFSHNMVVTNGLIELPDWKDVQFHISLDGDQNAHEKMRNEKDIYEKIKKTAHRPDLHVVMAYCISSLNVHCIESVLEEWKNIGIKGFLFSFYTPIEGIEDPLFPGWDKRDEIIDRLITLKEQKYGSFIQNEPRVLELMKKENSKKVTDQCAFVSKGFALSPMANRKAKCMMGEKADCDKCGCVVPFYLHWRLEKKKVLNDLKSDLSGYFSSRVRHLFSSNA